MRNQRLDWSGYQVLDRFKLPGSHKRPSSTHPNRRKRKETQFLWFRSEPPTADEIAQTLRAHLLENSRIGRTASVLTEPAVEKVLRRAYRRRWHAVDPKEHLWSLALELGSDCPFVLLLVDSQGLALCVERWSGPESILDSSERQVMWGRSSTEEIWWTVTFSFYWPQIPDLLTLKFSATGELIPALGDSGTTVAPAGTMFVAVSEQLIDIATAETAKFHSRALENEALDAIEKHRIEVQYPRCLGAIENLMHDAKIPTPKLRLSNSASRHISIALNIEETRRLGSVLQRLNSPVSSARSAPARWGSTSADELDHNLTRQIGQIEDLLYQRIVPPMASAPASLGSAHTWRSATRLLRSHQPPDALDPTEFLWKIALGVTSHHLELLMSDATGRVGVVRRSRVVPAQDGTDFEVLYSYKGGDLGVNSLRIDADGKFYLASESGLLAAPQPAPPESIFVVHHLAWLELISYLRGRSSDPTIPLKRRLEMRPSFYEDFLAINEEEAEGLFEAHCPGKLTYVRGMIERARLLSPDSGISVLCTDSWNATLQVRIAQSDLPALRDHLKNLGVGLD